MKLRSAPKWLAPALPGTMKMVDRFLIASRDLAQAETLLQDVRADLLARPDTRIIREVVEPRLSRIVAELSPSAVSELNQRFGAALIIEPDSLLQF